MYTAQDLVQNIKNQAKQKNILIRDMLVDCDLNINTLSQISNKKGLASFSLARIADYLDCSVDYLLGRTDEQTGTYHANNVSSSFVQNDGAVTLGPVSVSSAFNSNSNDIASSKEETEILNIYRSLEARDRTKFMNFVFEMQDDAAKA